MKNTRRSFLTKSALTAGGVLASKNLIAKSLCNAELTPAQAEGPFYPVQFPKDLNFDLTTIKGKNKVAKGKTVIVRGIIQDQHCKPVEGAIVEIWQACHSGKYMHPSDTSNHEYDENFQYYGVVKTNDKGEYLFKTIIPGEYVASGTWVRPPHIHYKVSLRGYESLTTQMYFKGFQSNQYDHVLQRLTKAEKEQVIVDFKEEKNKTPIGIFNITLQKF